VPENLAYLMNIVKIPCPQRREMVPFLPVQDISAGSQTAT
jgi:hypothetical protein